METSPRIQGGEGLRPADRLLLHQLAHAVRDPNGRAYNRTAHLPERRAMMQAWADWLDARRSDAAGQGAAE